jgi:hypothetical protein
MQRWVKATAIVIALATGFSTSTVIAQEPRPKEAPKEAAKEPPRQPPSPTLPPPGGGSAANKWKRVIHAIEMSTSKREAFGGRLVVRLESDANEPMLSYYWGGKCKGTELQASRIQLVLEAMKSGWSVEVMGFPIKHEDRITMCMQSIRVLAE